MSLWEVGKGLALQTFSCFVYEQSKAAAWEQERHSNDLRWFAIVSVQ